MQILSPQLIPEEKKEIKQELIDSNQPLGQEIKILENIPDIVGKKEEQDDINKILCQADLKIPIYSKKNQNSSNFVYTKIEFIKKEKESIFINAINCETKETYRLTFTIKDGTDNDILKLIASAVFLFCKKLCRCS